MKKRPWCFIAMAFGYSDTDKIYEKHIKKIVEKCGLVPRRVDRVLHNDYIDRKIINEIDNASFCIADLTYARQSVYFEAGYAQRKIPVIYTCRKDHFTSSDDAKKVHFDLRQRNIVSWNDEKDKNFPKELKRRLEYLARPVIEKYNKNLSIEKEEAKFSRLSARSKLKSIDEATKNIMLSHSYHQIEYDVVEVIRLGAGIWPFPGRFFYQKRLGSNLLIVRVASFQALNKNILEREKNYWLFKDDELLKKIPEDFKKGVKYIRNIGFLITLQPINYNTTVKRVLANYSSPLHDDHYIEDAPEKKKRKTKSSASMEFAFLDKVKSISELKEKYIYELKKIEKYKNKKI